MNISQLKHTVKKLPNDGMVLVLDTGAVVTAEDEAMLQALHSRSVGGILKHLKTLEKSGSGKLMKDFYVGYGHKSIGDCGHGVIFIEGVSMLAAKAIQDWRLYSGQESSTRYIDFANQLFLNPANNTIIGKEILEKQRNFYIEGLLLMIKEFERRFPYKEEWDEADYKKTIKARAFDVMRGFLPAGATTNLSWSSNLRQTADKLMYLRHHPLSEVRDISIALEKAIEEHFPNSFGHKRYKKTELYNKTWMNMEYYHTTEEPKEFTLTYDGIDRELLKNYGGVMASRPKKTELPFQIAECGVLRYELMLDFASYRDIQRHRAVIQRMPLHTMHHGFHPWYLEQLPSNLRSEAEKLLQTCEDVIPIEVTGNWLLGQYYIPMGYKMPNRITGDLHALVYLVELRATRFVHPTLRQQVFLMADMLEKMFGEYGLKLYTDNDSNAFDVKRGKQDIVKK